MIIAGVAEYLKSRREWRLGWHKKLQFCHMQEQRTFAIIKLLPGDTHYSFRASVPRQWIISCLRTNRQGTGRGDGQHILSTRSLICILEIT